MRSHPLGSVQRWVRRIARDEMECTETCSSRHASIRIARAAWCPERNEGLRRMRPVQSVSLVVRGCVKIPEDMCLVSACARHARDCLQVFLGPCKLCN